MQQLEALVDVCRWIGQQGWVPATSGNFSIKSPENQIWLTVSGVHKAKLTINDLIKVDNQSNPIQTTKKPSAETLLHTALYSFYPDISCVLHTHSYSGTLLSILKKQSVTLSNYELLKVFPNQITHETQITIPIFENTQNMNELASELLDYLSKHSETCAFLIRGHGLYTWGKTIEDAQRHLEALEFLFQLEIGLWRHTQHA